LSAPPTFILLLAPPLLLPIPSLGATLPLPASTLALPGETTGLGGLTELKYRLPPGLEGKKDKYALQFAGGGLNSRSRKDMKSSCGARTAERESRETKHWNWPNNFQEIYYFKPEKQAPVVRKSFHFFDKWPFNGRSADVQGFIDIYLLT